MYEEQENVFTTEEVIEEKNRPIDSIIIGILIALIVIMLCLIVYRYSFITVGVSGESMEQTISSGDSFVVNRFAKPERDDVIVINIDEKGNKGKHFWIIKRVIGIEGDSIKIDGEKVYRKTPEDSDYVLLDKITDSHAWYNPEAMERNFQVEVTLGVGEIYFLGDNRRNSNDSRFYGPRTYNDVIGVVTDWSMEKQGFMYKFDKIANAPSRWFGSLTKQIGDG